MLCIGSAIKGQCCLHVSDPACSTGSVVDGRRANTHTPSHHAAALRPAAQCTPQSIQRVHTLPGLVLEGFGPHSHRLVNVQHNARWVSLLIRRQAAWVQPSHHLRQRFGGGGVQMPHALQLQRWEGDKGRGWGVVGCLDASRTIAAAKGAVSGAFCTQAAGAMRSGSRGEPHSRSAPRAASCTASHVSHQYTLAGCSTRRGKHACGIISTQHSTATAQRSAPCPPAQPGGCPSAAGWAPPPAAAAGAASQRCCPTLRVVGSGEPAQEAQ